MKQAKDKNFLHKIIQNQAAERSDASMAPIPAVGDKLKQIKYILDESPKLRCLFALLGDINFYNQEKVVIWTSYPAQQLLITVMLRTISIKARAIFAGTSVSDRNKLVEEFQHNPTVEVLILTYLISSAGLNLQKQCHQVIHIDVPVNRVARQQSDGRNRRIGATHDVVSWQISIRKTFGDRQYINMLNKALPNIVVELNRRVFMVSTEEDAVTGGITLELGSWVLAGGVLTPAGSTIAQAAKHTRKLETQEVIEAIHDIEQGLRIQFDE